MHTVVVTGANGLIGKQLCKLLDEKEVKTYAVLRDKKSMLNGFWGSMENCIPVICSLDHISDLPLLVTEPNIDVVYHLAWGGVSGALRGNYNIQIENIKYTMDLIIVASKMGCRRFVGVGTTAEYDANNACYKDGVSPNLTSLYGTSKICTHFMSKILCNNMRMQHMWAYLGNTYGSEDMGNNFISFAVNLILSDDEAEFTSGEQYYDFVYVTDIAYGLYCIGDKGIDKCSYYVGSGNPRKLKEYIFEIRDVLNPHKELKLGKIPFNGVSSELSDFDIEKLKRDTGYEAKVSFEEGIRMIAKKHAAIERKRGD